MIILENKVKNILKIFDLSIENMDYNNRIGKIAENRPALIMTLTSQKYKREL